MAILDAMSDAPQKPATDIAAEIKSCENSIRSLESRRNAFKKRYEGDDLAKRLKEVDEKILQRQEKLVRLMKEAAGVKE